MRDVDGVLWTVPNGEILKVGNATKGWSRSKLDVSVAYGTDLRRAMDVVQEVGDGLGADPDWEMDVLEPPDMWGIQHLAADGVTIRLVLKVRPGRQYAVTRSSSSGSPNAWRTRASRSPSPSAPSGSATRGRVRSHR